MVQKEIRKKTKIYGAAAVLSAVILVSLIYAFGAAPGIFPPTKTPFVSGMTTFSSLQDLENYINTSQGSSSFAGGPLDSQFFGAQRPTPSAAPSTFSAPSTASNSENALGTYSVQTGSSYSTTNVQVAGVDEADTVKTDGQYIYTVSTTQNTGYYFGGSTPETSNAVYIVNADPQNPQVISKILLGNDTEPAGLFLSSDGNKLVVIASKYQFYAYPLVGGAVPTPNYGYVGVPMIPAYQADVYTYINVYDITNKADPVLTRNFTVSGSYFDSRMIGNYVYAVVSQPAMVYNNNVTMPTIYNGNAGTAIAPTSVYYTNMVAPSYYTFTSFFGINLADDTQQPTNMTVMMGGASTMYVSQNNMYVTYPSWTNSGEFTSIYRVSINGPQLAFEAQGSVPGYTINQYSMDEYNGYFRIATNWYQDQTQSNNIYVLNSSLAIVGKLEGLAPNENLYATRFIGDTCYLVTSNQIDPFFVIDLSNPLAPRVAGELKIPGYSSFLQPYDANHVIGVGEVNDTLKLSLFDVTDLNNPIEIASYHFPGNYSYSSALNDAKAVLFDLQKQLLVIPASITNYHQTNVQPNQSNVVPGSAKGSGATNSSAVISPPISPPIILENTQYWQGAYVFNINATSGFTLKGTITQLNSTLLDSQGFVTNSTDYYSSQNNYITRSLYIGNTLYTVSNAEIELTNLTDMTQIAQVNLT